MRLRVRSSSQEIIKTRGIMARTKPKDFVKITLDGGNIPWPRVILYSTVLVLIFSYLRCDDNEYESKSNGGHFQLHRCCRIVSGNSVPRLNKRWKENCFKLKFWNGRVTGILHVWKQAGNSVFEHAQEEPYKTCSPHVCVRMIRSPDRSQGSHQMTQ